MVHGILNGILGILGISCGILEILLWSLWYTPRSIAMKSQFRKCQLRMFEPASLAARMALYQFFACMEYTHVAYMAHMRQNCIILLQIAQFP